jgi:hypothetical protein
MPIHEQVLLMIKDIPISINIRLKIFNLPLTFITNNKMKKQPTILCLIVMTMITLSSFYSKAHTSTSTVGIGTNDLVEKLSKSKVFESFSLAASKILLLSSYRSIGLSEKQLKYEASVMDAYKDRLDLTFPEKLEIATIGGFATWEQCEESFRQLNELKIRLNLEIPELRMLDAKDLQNTMEEALSKTNIIAKITTNLPKLVYCTKKAETDRVYCQGSQAKEPSLYIIATSLVVSCISIGFIGISVAFSAFSITTAGVGAPAALVAYLTAAGTVLLGCQAFGASAYDFATNNIQFNKTYCQQRYESALNLCKLLYKD